MGQAIITENIGEGLYKIKLVYNLAPLEKELTDLEKAALEYYTILDAARITLDDLWQAKADAKDGLDAVVEQWKEAVLNAANEVAPPIPPPASHVSIGVDDAEAFAAALFDAANAYRAALVPPKPELTRQTPLNKSIKALLYTIAASGKAADTNWTAVQRAENAGYLFDPAIGAAEVVNFGRISVEKALEAMLKQQRYKEALEFKDYVECGTAYLYWKNNPYSYFWGLILSAPGEPDPVPATKPPKPPDPAKSAADASEGDLKKIEVPKLDDFEPSQLGEAASAFGMAVAAYKMAADKITKLEAEKVERDKRITQLKKIKKDVSTPIYAWACEYVDDIAVNTAVATAEVPGWYDTTGRPTTTIMGRRDDDDSTGETTVDYEERDINIVLYTETGQLRSAETMSDALVFLNCALEAAHLRWKPLWRYGVVTARDESGCAVTLDNIGVRTMMGLDSGLVLDKEKQLSAVPVVMRCDTIAANDAVIVKFSGQDRAQPQIIGFRREPKMCESGRIGWQEIIYQS